MQTPGPPGLELHWASFVHGPHRFSLERHTGSCKPQSELETHSTQRPEPRSQAGAPPPQASLPATWQPTQTLPRQKAFPAVLLCWAWSVDSTQRPLPESQIGAGSVQDPAGAIWQPRHRFITQKAAAGLLRQCRPESVHSTHFPEAESQVGVDPLQAPVPTIAQPAHRFSRQKARAGSGQSIWVTHSRQRPEVASHAGAPGRPVQSVAAAHFAHRPARQSGASAGQASSPTQGGGAASAGTAPLPGLPPTGPPPAAPAVVSMASAAGSPLPRSSLLSLPSELASRFSLALTIAGAHRSFPVSHRPLGHWSFRSQKSGA
jgi:hypothetical protein